MADPLTNYLREGYPKQSENSEGYQTLLEYVGPQDSLYGQATIGEPWGDYQGVVEDLNGEPITGTDPLLAILTIRMLRKFGDTPNEAGQQGLEQESRFEIDWVDITRPLIEHPSFGDDGNFALSVSDRQACLKWEEMDVPEFKEAYKYFPGPYSQWDGSESSLLTMEGINQQKYADGRLKGIEFFVEKAPVLRKSTTYVDGVPPQGGAGRKEDPPDFPLGLKPTGYEYIRSADRSNNVGEQNKWQRDQEWLGAPKVLIDSQNLYY